MGRFMPSVQQPAIVGTFYSGDPEKLSHSLSAHLNSPFAWDIEAKALAVPHAGHVYSGPIAGTAYASVRHLSDRIKRVVLIGPTHRARFKGIALPSADSFATPLGNVPVDWKVLSKAISLPRVKISDAAFEGEHSLEVHLPFLQHALDEFSLVPLLVGDATPEHVDQVLQKVWGGPETLIVVSTDLSHFHDYDTARKKDAEATRAIETFNVGGLNGGLACGFLPLSGLLQVARRLDLRPTALDVRNSGDTVGDKKRVVGYGSYAFEYSGIARIPEKFRSGLIAIAQRSIRHGVKTGRCPNVDIMSFPQPMRTMRRTFVSIHANGKLRGCVGSIGASNHLVTDVVQNAYRAAFQDKRFKALTDSDLEGIDLGVSILSTPRPMEFDDEAHLAEQIQPDKDGLILSDGDKSGVFLPVVWEQNSSPREFVRRLKNKAGLPLDYWSDSLQVWRYTTETFSAKFSAASPPATTS
ncbi:AmmeMemoRadiSam system protein B [Alphaproteobacteria bacterium]|nr:AmmeMemoRadiSam system protein B [Alphaproteobacteria bacterium]